MNVSTQTAISARSPRFGLSRTPRIVAAVAAIVVAIVVLNGVALLGG